MKLYEYNYHRLFEDLWLFQKYDLLSRVKVLYIIDIICGSIVFMIALGFLILNVFFQFEITFFTVFLLIIGLLIMFYPLIQIYWTKLKIKVAYKAEPGFDADENVTINDDSIERTCANVTTKVDYSAITEYVITPQMIILYFGSLRAILIPRRLFNNDMWNWLHNFFMNKFNESNTKITISNKVINP